MDKQTEARLLAPPTFTGLMLAAMHLDKDRQCDIANECHRQMWLARGQEQMEYCSRAIEVNELQITAIEGYLSGENVIDGGLRTILENQIVACKFMNTHMGHTFDEWDQLIYPRPTDIEETTV